MYGHKLCEEFSRKYYTLIVIEKTTTAYPFYQHVQMHNLTK